MNHAIFDYFLIFLNNFLIISLYPINGAGISLFMPALTLTFL